MKLVFIIHNFNRPNHNLQPRQFVHRVGYLLVNNGHKITVITDKCIEDNIDGISVIGFNNSACSKQEAYLEIINNLMPDVVILSTSFTSMFANWKLLKNIKVPVVANFSFPVYGVGEIVRQIYRLPLRSTLYYLLNHILRFPSARRMKGDVVKLIVCQSKNNKDQLAKLGINNTKIFHLPPGIEKKVWFQNGSNRKSVSEKCFTFLFFGPARNARGLQILLDAFSKISPMYPEANLDLLLRGANEEDLQKVVKQLKQYGIIGKVNIVGGWVSAEELRLAIWECSIVVIPFVFSESDMPVTILEAKACGKPVISTNLCSIPEMVGCGGIVVSANSVKHLVSAMSKVIEEPEYLEKLQDYAITEMSVYPTWENISDQFLRGVKNAIEE